MPTDPFDALRGMEFQTREEAMNWIDDNVRPSGFLNGTYEVSSVLHFLESRIRPHYEPCPHCGTRFVNLTPQKHDWKDVVTDTWKSETRYVIVCQTCGAHGPHAKTEGKAISHWNRRDQLHATH